MTDPSPPSSSAAQSVHIFPDLEALSRAAAQHVAAHIETVLTRRERYALALAGGQTPQRLYELLATVYSGHLPWARVDFFWGDERFVPHDDPASNVRLAREGLLDAIEIPPDNVHPIPTSEPTAEAAADAYEDVLRRRLGDREHTFDLALLGLGADGHTASLFPGAAPGDDDRWVRPVEAPPTHEVRERVTCTLPVFSRANEALFLVAGAGKRDALAAVLDDRDSSLPASHVAPRKQLAWFADEAARPAA
jgi:6-phosphogluconolactonase